MIEAPVARLMEDNSLHLTFVGARCTIYAELGMTMGTIRFFFRTDILSGQTGDDEAVGIAIRFGHHLTDDRHSLRGAVAVARRFASHARLCLSV